MSCTRCGTDKRNTLIIVTKGTCAVTASNPHYLRWVSVQKALLPEVRVFGDYGETVFAGMLPHVGIVRSLKVYIANVYGIRINACQSSRQSRRQILVEQQPHSDGTETNWRSRSAANAKQARMSARSRSGKSERI